MNTSEKKSFAAKLRAAQLEARKATAQYIAEQGENPMGCGFAWVEVSGIRGHKLNLLKEFGFKKKYVGAGHSMWNPSGNYTQDMDAKYIGAQVFAEQLQKMDIPAYAGCRLD